ncbi:MAG: DUF1858 domain-containing protein [Clostridia bacterium]
MKKENTETKAKKTAIKAEKCCCKHCCCEGKKQITAETTIGEVLSINKKNQAVLMGFGMHCLACPMSQLETVKEAAEAHEIDLKFMLEKLNG